MIMYFFFLEDRAQVFHLPQLNFMSSHTLVRYSLNRMAVLGYHLLVPVKDNQVWSDYCAIVWAGFAYTYNDRTYDIHYIMLL